MLDDTALSALHARLAAALAPPRQALVPLLTGGSVVGALTPARVDRVARWERIFRVNNGAVEFVPDLADEPARTAAMAGVARTLADEGALSPWRDERYAVAAGDGAPVLFRLERAAARYFGVHTVAVHVNGLVRAAGGRRMWLARRSPTKAIDPSQLDNLVGGGVAADTDVPRTLVKEAWEEAGIDAALARTAQPCGTVGIRRQQPDGLQWETIHVHDLWLPASFVPSNQDGEAVEHRCVVLPEAAVLAAHRDGPDLVTADASLVILDCLLRHGLVPETSRWHAPLRALLRPAPG
ncbi:MAG: DUF4743 domain-containing protein [Burkholderiales bacterium]